MKRLQSVSLAALAALAAVALVLPAAASAAEEEETLNGSGSLAPAAEEAPSEEPVLPPEPITGIHQAVQAAKLMLEEERLKRLEIWKGQPPVFAEFPAKAEIVLAVWRKDYGTVNLYLADKQGVRLWLKSPGAPPITVSLHAQLKSRYAIAPEHSAAVVGVLYPLMEKGTDGGRTVYRTNETVYVPVSRDLFTPDILSAGSDYLSFLIQDALEEAARRGIRSRAFPDRLLSEVIDPYLVKSIVTIEHSGHQQLLSDNNPESVLGSFYVNLAVNREGAFSTAESSAGALGLAQFIPSTYALFVKNRPDLGLIPDFREGMADHRNAVIAMAAYFDDSLRMLPAELRESYLKSPAAAADYLAAAYNGGITRVRRAYSSFGAAWDQFHGGTNSLRPETVTYVAKLRRVYAMMESGVYATPAAPANALPNGASLASLTAPAPSAAPLPDSLAGLICFGDGSCVSLAKDSV